MYDILKPFVYGKFGEWEPLTLFLERRVSDGLDPALRGGVG